MALVVAKITGDGLSPATAFSTAPQRAGCRITRGARIPVHLNNGRPLSGFVVMEIEDADVPLIESDADCTVISTANRHGAIKAAEKGALISALARSGAVVVANEIATPEQLFETLDARVPRNET